MNPWSVLLRVVLIVVLVLNGAGTAAASVTAMRAAMPEGASTNTHAMQVPSVMRADMPCHDMAQMMTVAASPDEALQAPGHASHGKGKAATPDCCKSGACQCACTQAMHAALPAMPAFAVDSPHSDVAHPMPIGHADPALPHLVRPPIG